MSEPTPQWWTLLRPEYEDGGEQDGETRLIDGIKHIYGCTRDSRCLVDGRTLTGRGARDDLVVMCDCPCHNGEPHAGRDLTLKWIEAEVAKALEGFVVHPITELTPRQVSMALARAIYGKDRVVDAQYDGKTLSVQLNPAPGFIKVTVVQTPADD